MYETTLDNLTQIPTSLTGSASQPGPLSFTPRERRMELNRVPGWPRLRRTQPRLVSTRSPTPTDSWPPYGRNWRRSAPAR